MVYICYKCLKVLFTLDFVFKTFEKKEWTLKCMLVFLNKLKSLYFYFICKEK